MTNRKYLVEVTVKMKSPDGQDLGTETETVELDVDMADFANNTEADEHMMSELGSMKAAAASQIEDCFD